MALKNTVKEWIGSHDKLSKLIPFFRRINKLKSYVINLFLSILVPYFRLAYKNKLKELNGRKNTQKIIVVFIVRHASQWKYEGLYRICEQHDDYCPRVLVVPEMSLQDWFHDNSLCKKAFPSDAYNVIFAYSDKGELLVSPKDLKPDITFFPKVIWGEDPYSILNFKGSLNCYVPYSTYGDNNAYSQYNKVFHHLLWKHFVATNIHKKIAQKVSFTKAKNVFVTGYPGFDPYFFKKDDEQRADPWGSRDQRKRIIWAPHHTIDDSETESNHSNFLRMHDEFRSTALKFKDKIVVAFKPHPNLRRKLNLRSDWGEERTNQYYRWWDCNDNTLLVEGQYQDLFIKSDALIHDSVSFMAEYLCLLKPVCYVIKNEALTRSFLNEFGNGLLEQHYLAASIEHVEDFVRRLIVQPEYFDNEARREYVEVILRPPNNRPSSNNMFELVHSEINSP